MKSFIPHTNGELFGYALAAYLLGIAVHSIWPWTKIENATWVVLWLCVSVILSAAWPRRRLFVVALLCASAAFGVWRFDVSIPARLNGILPFIGQTGTFEGRVVALGKSRNEATVALRVERVAGRSVEGPGQTILALTKGVPPEVGSEVRLACSLRVPTTFPSNLERRRSLARKGIWGECAGSVEIERVSAPSPWDPLVGLAHWRLWLTARIARLLPPDEATLLTGILYGDQDLSPSLRDLFRRAGLTHLVAVSGSNVTIVVNLLFPLALALGLRRRKAFWIVSVGLVVFVGFVGFSASVLRAALMGWLVLVARELGRIAWTDHLLLVAAAFLTLTNPWLLAFDPGFALSFLATWGLLVWSPIFSRALTRIPKTGGMREAASTTCAATIMTIPYVAWAFGQMSLAGLLTNMFALPLVPWIMMWGALAAAWGNLPGSIFITLPVSGLINVLLRIAHIADMFPWLNLQIPVSSVYMLIASYVLLWQLWRRLQSKTDLSTDA
jgi:competence protein ComEC